MAQMFLPVLSHFQNKNPWTASAGRMRFRILPDIEALTLTVEIWEGPWSREFSSPELTETFPLSREGLDALPPWLDALRQEIEARPQPTLEEQIARKLQP